MSKKKIIDLCKRKQLKELSLERAEDMLTLVMGQAKSPALNDYILQSDILNQTAKIFYETELAEKERED